MVEDFSFRQSVCFIGTPVTVILPLEQADVTRSHIHACIQFFGQYFCRSLYLCEIYRIFNC